MNESLCIIVTKGENRMTLYDAYVSLLNTMCGGADASMLSLLASVATVATMVAVIIVPIIGCFKWIWTRK